MGDGPQRDQARRENLEEIAAEPGSKTTVESNPHTIVYIQAFSHPRLRWATRRMEVWKREPRASVTLRLHRTGNEAPEAFFVSFTLPCQGVSYDIEPNLRGRRSWKPCTLRIGSAEWQKRPRRFSRACQEG